MFGLVWLGPEKGGSVRVLEEMLPKFYKIESFAWSDDLKRFSFWTLYILRLIYLEKKELCFKLRLLINGKKDDED